jgi:hypothetical protein
MPAAPRPDSAPTAQRVKDLAKDATALAKDLAEGATGMAKDLARDVAEGYRKSTRYFRMRAAVVGAWAVLSVATLWAACPSSGPRNALGAEASLSEAFLGSQVLVRNESDAPWRDVVFTLDGGWRLERRTVRPGESVPLAVAQFRRGDETAPRDLRPRSVRIECSEGDATVPLGGR